MSSTTFPPPLGCRKITLVFDSVICVKRIGPQGLRQIPREVQIDECNSRSFEVG